MKSHDSTEYVTYQTLLSVKELDLSSGKLNLHADLERYVKTTEAAERPEILLSICFNESISRLTVTVVECKHLKVSKHFLT